MTIKAGDVVKHVEWDWALVVGDSEYEDGWYILFKDNAPWSAPVTRFTCPPAPDDIVQKLRAEYALYRLEGKE